MPRPGSESPVSWSVGIQKRPNRDHKRFRSLKGYRPGIRRRGSGYLDGRVANGVHAMSTGVRPMYSWDGLPWRKLEQDVFRLQTRIYQASRNGDKPLVDSRAPI